MKENMNTTMGTIVNVSLNGTTNNFSYMHYEFSYIATMIMYTNFILFLLGLLGNCLIIIVSIKSKYTLKPTMIYFTALAISDIIILVNNALVPASLDLFNYGINKALSSPFMCKVVLMWIAYPSVEVSSCILVIVTIERFICVTFLH